MICNAEGIALIKKFEGCKLQAYLDVVGIPTIGLGHTGPEVHLGLSWSQQQADDALVHDVLTVAEMPLNSMLAGLNLSSNQFSALCCLVYNIGSGAFRRSKTLLDIREGNLDDVPAQWLGFCHANGQVVQGLLNRRREELDLWRQE